MNIVMIFDQIQSGRGTKEDKSIPLTGTREMIGPAIMMKPYLKEIGARIDAIFYCGTGTYFSESDEVSRKICAMLEKIKPDVVVCGPAFNYGDYAKMCAQLATDITTKTSIKAFAVMSKENEDVIAGYKDSINIVKMPKKGDGGLNEALNNICIFAKTMVEGINITEIKRKLCF